MSCLCICVDCRDKSCDIRIVNKEVSRRHLEVYVNDDGNVCVLSMGREPICLNGEQVLSPRVLQSGDKIEVLLEGRTREFFFKASTTDKTAEEMHQAVASRGGIGSPLAASSIANQRASAIAETDEHENVEGMDVDGKVGNNEPNRLAKAVDDKVEDVPRCGGEIAETMEPKSENGGTIQDAEHPQNDVSMIERDVEYRVESMMGQGDVKVSHEEILDTVSRMVNEIITRVIQSAEAAESILTPVSTHQKRKSVRFVSMTPEGDACDATMTIRCTPCKDDNHTVMVEDNTIAFSEWGFKTMQKEATQEDAVECGKSGLQKLSSGKETPLSVNATNSGSIDKRLTPRSGTLEGNDFQYAPLQTTPGLAAPATTPVTATRPSTAQRKNREVDFNILARKLGEIAEEHDVQFELPKDFMRFTPLSTTRGKRRSIGDSQSCKIAPSKRLSLCSNSKEDGNLEYDLPKDFMRFTPMSVPIRSVQKDAKSGTTDSSGKNFDLPKDFMRFTPTSASGVKRQSSSTNGTVEYDLPKDFMRFTPMSVPSKRMDGTNIKAALNVIERSMSAVGNIQESEDDGAEEIATLRSVGHAVHDLADALDHVASVKKSGYRAKTPGVKITIVEKGNTFKTSNPEVKVLFGGAPALDTVICDGEKEVDDNTVEKGQEVKPATKADLLSRFKSALIQASSYKTQSLVLGKHLRKSSARLSKVKLTARVLSTKYRAEKAKRIELQNTLKKLIERREKEEEFSSGEEKSEQDHVQHAVNRVVVVGYAQKDCPSNLEIAGNVVVIRKPTTPSHLNTSDAITPAQKPMMNSIRRSSLKKSVRRISSGQEMHVIMDDIKMPAWIYEKEAEDEDANKNELEVEPDSQDEIEALQELENSIKDPLPEGPSEDEENMVEDTCHICNVGDDGDILLLCDSCDNACHLQCCQPPLKRVPKGDWFCVDCKEKTKPSTRNGPAKRKASATKKSPVNKKQAKENVSITGSKRSNRAASQKKSPAPTRTRRTRATARNA